MSPKKIPDNVVYNQETEKYDASLKAYGTNVGAPSIELTDTVAWKNRSITKVNQKVKTRFEELKAEYEQMLREFEYNKLIFEAKFSFEPNIGEEYHLYAKENGENFLSLIAPEQCKFDFIGSFYLNADQTWEKVE